MRLFSDLAKYVQARLKILIIFISFEEWTNYMEVGFRNERERESRYFYNAKK